MYEAKNKLKVWELALIVAFAISAAVSVLTTQQTMLSRGLVRLHVVAESDSTADQSMKLIVRDSVLETVQGLTAGCADAASAELRIASGLESIAAAAETVLRENGSECSVRVSLEDEFFPTTEYESFSLPAGEYRALRVSIGRAEGHNWWCVVFPQLCMAGSADAEVFSELGLDENEIRLITESDGYVVKFKLMEWAEWLLERLFG